MTMTQNPAPEVPAWLNIDEVCPPEVRAELVELANDAHALEPTIEDLARRCHEALTKAEVNLPESDGVILQEALEATGIMPMRRAVIQLVDLLFAGLGEGQFHAESQSPAWVRSEEAGR